MKFKTAQTEDKTMKFKTAQTEDKTMKNMTTQAAMEYVETLHQRSSNDARHMSIYEKVKEAKRALIKERDELESKCDAYDTYVSLCCERGGSYDAFYSFSDSLYDSMRNEMLKHVDDDEEYEAVMTAYASSVIAMLLRCISSCLKLMKQKSSGGSTVRVTSCAMQLLMKLST